MWVWSRGAAPGERNHINRSGLVNIQTMRLQGGRTGLRYVTLWGTQSVNSCWVSSQGSYLSSYQKTKPSHQPHGKSSSHLPIPPPPPRIRGWGSQLPVFFSWIPFQLRGKAQTASRGLVNKLIKAVHAHGWDIHKGIWSGTERMLLTVFLILIFNQEYNSELSVLVIW